MVQALMTLPAGYINNRFRRDRVMILSAAIGFIGIGISLFAFQSGIANMVYAVYAVWGAFLPVNNTALESIFADSLQTGARSEIFSIKHALMHFSLSVGPAFSIFCFFGLGNTWDLGNLKTVLSIASAASFVPIFSTLFFSDELYVESNNELDKRTSIGRFAKIESTDNAQTTDQYYFSAPVNITSSRSEVLVEMAFATDEKVVDKNDSNFFDDNAALNFQNEIDSRFQPVPILELSFPWNVVGRITSAFFNVKPRWIPYVIVITDIVRGWAAGMTIRYFPLFFMQEYGLEPISISLIFLVTPWVTAACSMVVAPLGLRFGRVQTIVGVQICAALALLLMSLVTPFWGMLCLYIIRTSFIRSTKPLSRSLLMDAVHQSERGGWNSLESLTIFSFCGSAFIGAYLIESNGYRFCFVVTALLSMSANIITSILVVIVPKEQRTPEIQTQPTLLNTDNQSIEKCSNNMYHQLS